jgi:hypothetical protein
MDKILALNHAMKLSKEKQEAFVHAAAGSRAANQWKLENTDVDQYWMTPRDENLMRDLRYLMRENQTQFWQRFGVSQSRGSRFERGMAIPLPVLLLIRLYLLRIVGDQDLRQVQSPEYEAGHVR